MTNEDHALSQQEAADIAEEKRELEAQKITDLVLSGHSVSGITNKGALDAFISNMNPEEVDELLERLARYVSTDKKLQAMLEPVVMAAALEAVAGNFFNECE